MTAVPEEVEEKIRSALKPSRTEVVRAKQMITSLVSGAESVGIGRIQRVLIEAEGVREPEQNEKLTMAEPNDVSDADLKALPLIAHKRLALAACEALVDLESQGLLVEVATVPPNEGPHRAVINANHDVTIGLQYRNLGTSVHLRSPVPQFSDGYRLAPRYADSGFPWFAEPDLFLADVDELWISTRARRCVSEALEAYRKGLYLACATLLGTASEGAWHSAAARLASISENLRRTLAKESVNSLDLRKKVVEVLSRKGSPGRALTPGLESTAELLRRMRNYAVHPTDVEDADLERYFTEAGCGQLLLEVHSYLTNLGRAVDLRLAHDSSDK